RPTPSRSAWSAVRRRRDNGRGVVGIAPPALGTIAVLGAGGEVAPQPTIDTTAARAAGNASARMAMPVMIALPHRRQPRLAPAGSVLDVLVYGEDVAGGIGEPRDR